MSSRPGPRSPIILQAGTTEVRFEWHGDRWQHAVTGPGGHPGGWHSLEGPADDGDPRWPLSPVLVELNRLGSGSADPVMGIGLAGRSHYSAVVSPDPAVPGTVRFEIAARLHETPLGLGSTYRAGGRSIRIVPLASSDGPLPRTVQWAYRIGPDGIDPLPGARLIETTHPGGQRAADGRAPA